MDYDKDHWKKVGDTRLPINISAQKIVSLSTLKEENLIDVKTLIALKDNSMIEVKPLNENITFLKCNKGTIILYNEKIMAITRDTFDIVQQ